MSFRITFITSKKNSLRAEGNLPERPSEKLTSLNTLTTMFQVTLSKHGTHYGLWLGFPNYNLILPRLSLSRGYIHSPPGQLNVADLIDILQDNGNHHPHCSVIKLCFVERVMFIFISSL